MNSDEMQQYLLKQLYTDRFTKMTLTASYMTWGFTEMMRTLIYHHDNERIAEALTVEAVFGLKKRCRVIEVSQDLYNALNKQGHIVSFYRAEELKAEIKTLLEGPK